MSVRLWPAVKTGMLVVLVGLSLVLSEELWTGGWGAASEVSYSAEPSLPQASVPAEMDVTAPVRVVMNDGNPKEAAVFMPGTADYSDWLNRLAQAHVYGLRSTVDIPTGSFVRYIEFDFGVNLDYQELVHYVPGLQPSVLAKQGQTIYLYQTSRTGPVMLGLQSDSGSYTAQTDLNVYDFSSLFHRALLIDPWEVWNQETSSYVPKTSLDMFDITAKVNTRSMVPIIHSFFVNPQALTSVPESASTILWTDGSRAVWWDQQQHTLTYADPNLGTGPDTRSMAVPDILNFAKAHGGAPDGSLMTESSSVAGNSTNWTLQPYLMGFPVLDSSQSVQVETVNTHITQYQIPADTFTISDKMAVPIIDASHLADILSPLMPSTPISDLTVELGYLYRPVDAKNARFVPAYFVSQSGMPLWEIDAVTGKVIKGMKVS